MIESILWVLFIAACLLVSTVILLQEGKGGGLAEAFGGVGQQTFGVKAEGINKFTAYVAVTVVLIAISITLIRRGSALDFVAPVDPPPLGAPVDTGAGAGAGGAGTTGDAGSKDKGN